MEINRDHPHENKQGLSLLSSREPATITGTWQRFKGRQNRTRVARWGKGKVSGVPSLEALVMGTLDTG